MCLEIFNSVIVIIRNLQLIKNVKELLVSHKFKGVDWVFVRKCDPKRLNLRFPTGTQNKPVTRRIQRKTGIVVSRENKRVVNK